MNTNIKKYLLSLAFCLFSIPSYAMEPSQLLGKRPRPNNNTQNAQEIDREFEFLKKNHPTQFNNLAKLLEMNVNNLNEDEKNCFIIQFKDSYEEVELPGDNLTNKTFKSLQKTHPAEFNNLVQALCPDSKNLSDHQKKYCVDAFQDHSGYGQFPAALTNPNQHKPEQRLKEEEDIPRKREGKKRVIEGNLFENKNLHNGLPVNNVEGTSSEQWDFAVEPTMAIPTPTSEEGQGLNYDTEEIDREFAILKREHPAEFNSLIEILRLDDRNLGQDEKKDFIDTFRATFPDAQFPVVMYPTPISEDRQGLNNNTQVINEKFEFLQRQYSDELNDLMGMLDMHSDNLDENQKDILIEAFESAYQHIQFPMALKDPNQHELGQNLRHNEGVPNKREEKIKYKVFGKEVIKEDLEYAINDCNIDDIKKIGNSDPELFLEPFYDYANPLMEFLDTICLDDDNNNNNEIKMAKTLIDSSINAGMNLDKKIFLDINAERTRRENFETMEIGQLEMMGQTNPLQQAIRSGEKEIVKYLLDKGADVNILFGNNGVAGDSLLTSALSSPGDAEGMILILLQRKPKLDTLNMKRPKDCNLLTDLIRSHFFLAAKEAIRQGAVLSIADEAKLNSEEFNEIQKKYDELCDEIRTKNQPQGM